MTMQPNFSEDGNRADSTTSKASPRTTRRRFIGTALGATGAFIAGEGLSGADDTPPKTETPNILLLETDDHHWQALGCMGHPLVETPNIDRLADRGVVFRNMVCQGAMCAPSRMSLLSGCYPHNNGIYHNRDGIDEYFDWTFPMALQRAGYFTMAIGKNHFKLPIKWKNYQEQKAIEGWKKHGFSDIFAVAGKVAAGRGWRDGPYQDYLRKHNLLKTHRQDYKKHRHGRFYGGYLGASPLPPEHSHDAFIGRNAANWIKSYSQNRPFFLWVEFVAPHFPADLPEPYASMYDPDAVSMPPTDNLDDAPAHIQRKAKNWKEFCRPEFLRPARAGYYGMITLMDKWVGEIIDALDQNGQLDNTVIVFVGDQGNMLGEHGLWGKGQFYKGSIGAPMVISYPARFRTTGTVHRPVEMLDLVPTFLQLADASDSDRRRAMGHSLFPLLTDKGSYQRDAAFAERRHAKMIATDRYKYVHSPKWDKPMFFYTKGDTEELDNLAERDDLEHVRKRLQSRLDKWLSDTADIKR